jgi:Methyltransferase domain
MMLNTRIIEDEMGKEINIPFQETPIYLKELEKLDSFWGGHKTCRMGFQLFYNKIQNLDRPVIIAQLGCGAGYELKELKTFLIKHQIDAKLIGIDANAANIAFATKNLPNSDISWIVGEYDDVQWIQGAKPDIIFSSLFCHNFSDEELILYLRWLKENSRIGFFITELKRNKTAYFILKLYTRLFVKSKTLQQKSIQAIKQAFTKDDWKYLLNKAGIRRFKIKEAFANRLLVYVKHES